MTLVTGRDIKIRFQTGSVPGSFTQLDNSLDELQQEVAELASRDPFYVEVERHEDTSLDDNIFVRSQDYEIFLYEDGVFGRGDFEKDDDLFRVLEQHYNGHKEDYFWIQGDRKTGYCQ